MQRQSINSGMEGQSCASTIKNKERVRLYKNKVRRQHRAGRVNRLKQIASKGNDKLKMTTLKKTVNETTVQNKLLQRYV